jgi:hypothetical protein
MLLITRAQVASIVPLRELRGLSTGALDKGSHTKTPTNSVDQGVAEQVKLSLVRMADNYDKLFVHELVHTQLFEAYHASQVLTWLTQHPVPVSATAGSLRKGRGVEEGGGGRAGAMGRQAYPIFLTLVTVRL